MFGKSCAIACGLLIAGLLPVCAGDDYFDWAEANGLVGVFADPDADLDADGISNLMAYAFDLAPMNDDEAWLRLPSLAFLGDPPEPVMLCVLPPEIPRDVCYVVEVLGDAGQRVEIARKNGRGAWGGIGEIRRVRLDDGCTEVRVSMPIDMAIPELARPLRLRVEFLP
ncbi:MAG: hypothetical protein EAZ84_05100 [Verrucomicrobia bacterium]|nr:MAG: hypothetical protein EAZ84_05100 [Verrucomicrobiota bacterium]TAE88677.1 MAG: hypothetical protein EAZ82_02935 [Verrucomicrobiota bacterium]TAF26479.1 MAG: hypothetical protein EAZ71_04460 [Verrucomicrobiota bacterium]